MTIVNKILNSFETFDGGETRVFYGNAFDLNNIVENVHIGEGVIVLLNEVANTTLIYEPVNQSYVERADVLLFFLSISQYDRDSIGNEAVIDRCRHKLGRWLMQFSAYNVDVRLSPEIQLTRVYDKTDTILTGLAVSLTITEDAGLSRCGVE